MAATFRIDRDSCIACNACVRVCPTGAVVVGEDDEIRIEEGQCVACGLCDPACHHEAILVEGARDRSEELLRSGRTILVLGSEAEVVFRPATFVQIVNACRAAGFREVYSAVLGDELVAREYLKVLGSLDGDTVVRSSCPITVDYIRQKHPELLEALVPVATPAEAAARYLRAAYRPAEIRVVYAGAGGSWSPDGEAAIDASITLQDLGGILEGRGLAPLGQPDTLRALPQERRRHLSVPGGMPLPVLAEERMITKRIRKVRGLDEVAAVARAVSEGEPLGFVDLRAWDGNLAHPSMGPMEELFERRRLAATSEPSRAPTPVLDPEISVDLGIRYQPKANGTAKNHAEVVELVLEQIGTGPDGEPWDSGACGYDTCEQFADAVAKGRATLRMCPRAQERRAEKAERDAAFDALTGLYTYRIFEERLQAEVARLRRTESLLSLIVLDLDEFKAVNDHHGHQAGNRILQQVGRAIEESVRKSDHAARFGGDEFVVLLPETDQDGARIVGEKIRDAIAAIEPPAGPPETPVTASFGLATYAGSAEEDLRPEPLFEAADAALYDAKTLGGNALVVAKMERR